MNASAQLAGFAASLRFEDLPEPVVRRAEDLLVDWFASALAGKGARPVESILHFTQAMGPHEGADAARCLSALPTGDALVPAPLTAAGTLAARA